MTENQYNSIKGNVEDIKKRIAAAAIKAGRDPNEISLMAVTKTISAQKVNIAVENGIKLLGENKAQELTDKISEYNKDEVAIHFIGSLQTNKVRQIIDHVTMIQSVDRLSLAKEIEKQAGIRNRIIDVLIQVNVGLEESKSGVEPENVVEFSKKLKDFPHLKLRGLMAIPPICDDNSRLLEYFGILRQSLVDIREEKSDNSSVNVLSMGMSDDFEAAIACGSTLVRIGSALFGERS